MSQYCTHLGPGGYGTCRRVLPCPSHGWGPHARAPLEYTERAIELLKWNLIRLPPEPSILELLGKWSLTKSERARVFDAHDPGDEDPRARNFGRWVCGLRLRANNEGRERSAPCELDPNHWGPHDWETPPVPVAPPMFVYRRSVIATGGHDPGDES